MSEADSGEEYEESYYGKGSYGGGGEDDEQPPEASVAQSEYESREQPGAQEELEDTVDEDDGRTLPEDVDWEVPPEEADEMGIGSVARFAVESDDEVEEVSGIVIQNDPDKMKIDGPKGLATIDFDNVAAVETDVDFDQLNAEAEEEQADGRQGFDSDAFNAERRERAERLFDESAIDERVVEGEADARIAALLTREAEGDIEGWPSLDVEEVEGVEDLEEVVDETGRNKDAMDVGTVEEDGEEVDVFIINTDHGGVTKRETATEMAGWAMQRYLGLRTTPHQYLKDEGAIAKRGVEGHTVSSAPESVKDNIDREDAIEYLAGQMVLGNWDAKPENVIVNEEGDLTWIDNDFALGDLELWHNRGTNHNTPNRMQDFGAASRTFVQTEEVYERASEIANNLTDDEIDDLERIQNTVEDVTGGTISGRGRTDIRDTIETLRNWEESRLTE